MEPMRHITIHSSKTRLLPASAFSTCRGLASLARANLADLPRCPLFCRCLGTSGHQTRLVPTSPIYEYTTWVWANFIWAAAPFREPPSRRSAAAARHAVARIPSDSIGRNAEEYHPTPARSSVFD